MNRVFAYCTIAAVLLPSAGAAQEMQRCGNLYTNLRCPAGIRAEPLTVPLRVDRTALPADQPRARFAYQPPLAPDLQVPPGRGAAQTAPAGSASERTITPPRAAAPGRQVTGSLDEVEREIVAAKASLDVLCRTHAVANDAAARAVCSNALQSVMRAGMPLQR